MRIEKSYKLFHLVLMIKLILLMSFMRRVKSHGRLNEPPARNSGWRYNLPIPPDYNDNELNCGGAGVQHSTNGGKCGVCGDAYNAPIKQHEAGGLYATGYIGRTYTSGQIIDIGVYLSANHKGYMEFRICPVNNPKVEATQECLDKNLLQIIGKGTSYSVRSDERNISLQVQLPNDLTCTQCVLQWKYKAGNNWGTDKNGTSGPGLGPQEEFYNCADVAIKLGNGQFIPSDTTTRPIQTTSLRIFTTTTPSIQFTTSAALLESTNIINTNKRPTQKPIQTDTNAFKGQILCAILGSIKDSVLLYAKVKNCLELCSTPDKTCPSECVCYWIA